MNFCDCCGATTDADTLDLTAAQWGRELCLPCADEVAAAQPVEA